MATRIGGVVRDENLILNYNEPSGGLKPNVSNAQRKGGGGLQVRKPLGDLSNSLKPSFNLTSKKQNSTIFSVAEEKSSVSQIVPNAGKKKNVGGNRKALCDISNSGLPKLQETSKKINSMKLMSTLAEEEDGAGEHFLHNHNDCLKARKGAMTLDEFRKIIGLDDGFFQRECLPNQSLTEEMIEPSLMEEHPPQLTKRDSPPYCGSPISPRSHLLWNDEDYCCVNFMLIGSPEQLKNTQTKLSKF